MNHSPTLRLRPATRQDAPFLALALMEALGDDIMERIDAHSDTPADRERLQRITALCLRDDTLYSWRHGTIAETADGLPAGATIAYPGEGYHERRMLTFDLVKEHLHFDNQAMEDETQAGEHYLDTLAVLPRHRGQGVAQALLRHWLQQAQAQALTATLAAHPENHRALRLYRSMGLQEAGHLHIFGEDYLRMARG